MIIYSIYTKNHPVIPKEVVNVSDLWIPWYRNGFPRTTICLTILKEKKSRFVSSRKISQQNLAIKRIVIEHTICD